MLHRNSVFKVNHYTKTLFNDSLVSLIWNTCICSPSKEWHKLSVIYLEIIKNALCLQIRGFNVHNVFWFDVWYGYLIKHNKKIQVNLWIYNINSDRNQLDWEFDQTCFRFEGNKIFEHIHFPSLKNIYICQIKYRNFYHGLLGMFDHSYHASISQRFLHFKFLNSFYRQKHNELTRTCFLSNLQ